MDEKTLVEQLISQLERERSAEEEIEWEPLDAYEGKWVAIFKGKVIAASDNIMDIAPYVTRDKDDPRSAEEVPTAFKVPRKDEGPYVLSSEADL